MAACHGDKDTKPCVVPGCTNTIGKRSRLLVCRKHHHNAQYCNCRPCMSSRASRNGTPVPTYKDPWTPSVPTWMKEKTYDITP